MVVLVVLVFLVLFILFTLTFTLSQAEMTQFKKPKEKKKRRKVRKKKGSVLDDLAPMETGDDDRGSRKNAAKARRDADADNKVEAAKR